ncbi:carbamoyltransferase family protein [Halorientalis regularis]|uniref:Carbamoyltransferase n=1 Tax=Halorientalis regularis TaxID=660518 RepID=A0A1G7HFR8_9EURY|nr:carbamoyltransferase C-terminal domain-containing protein [Halorientalis regularis]SDE99228.1 carbamoyltransferase [Halorientalis regularis]
MGDEYKLSFKPSTSVYGTHDSSAVIFRNGELVHEVEEERFTREKHAPNSFPTNAIRSCLESCDIALPEVDEIIVPYEHELYRKRFPYEIRNAVSSGSILGRFWHTLEVFERLYDWKYRAIPSIEARLAADFSRPVPTITTRPHHACHAASAFHPSPFGSALGVTIDGAGEYDSTVVWHCTPDGLERVKTYTFPNSLGRFFGIVTEFLGFRHHNGEGKVMGLAPYGSDNTAIENPLRRLLDIGADHDVTPLTKHGYDGGVEKLESLFDRERSGGTDSYTAWEKDLAYTAQKLLEEICVAIVERYREELGETNVVLSGGVALNCKLNKRIMELPEADVFIQPVANDAGLAIGGGFIDESPADVEPMQTAYWGPSYERASIEATLEKNKVEYTEPEDITKTVAERLADGKIVGWFQGALEMGPRALGNRSILADPRTEASRDRVNKYVKHREGWRPFAPSLLESAADKYLQNWEESSFMIKTFDTDPDCRDDIQAVVHPADGTTRPQTVNEEQNPRYHSLISEFESITGVPVLLNTSFNDHGEPIVAEPVEALKDFYGMGLDCLALGDFLIEKDG